MNLSIVIPCFNEEKNLPHLLQKISAFNNPLIEFILVNNGSNDQSKVVLERAKASLPNIVVVHIENNIGYGHGILSGLNVAKGKYLGWTHADLQTDLSDINTAYTLLENIHFQPRFFIKGKRFGRPFIDVFFTFGMSVFESIYLKTKLSDINAQPTLFCRSFFTAWDNPPHDFALDLYAFYLATKLKLKIIRFPVFFGPRIYGHSHWNTGFRARLKFIRRTIQFSTTLKKRLS